MILNKVKVSLAAGLVASALTGVALTSGSASASSSSCATATSAAACGGMSALVKAAKAEGKLNVITLPSNWANYGTIMKDFTKKYGIKITDENPEGSSANEISAIQADHGDSQAPDVVDVGTSYAVQYPKLWAPYKVATWSDIPAAEKSASGTWFDDYGGYVAIGCDTKIVTTCPTTWADMLEPQYKGEVTINGDPTEASAAFSAVFAASLANGGSLNNIKPGIDWFQKLNAAGNYVPTSGTVSPQTTPIVIWWDYLQDSEIAVSTPGWTLTIPSNEPAYGAYYTQAITKNAPHPAAARLWEEFLYSTEGQNLFLAGPARPVELAAMVKAGTENKAAYAKLPAVPKSVEIGSVAQVTKAGTTVASDWASEVSSGA